MCGIAGSTIENDTILPKIIHEMRHRGPDGLGVKEYERVTLGHRRLSIIDLNERASQPMVSADGRFTIVFNGEIYNFDKLKKKLEADGVVFKTTSDTEVLLEGYIKKGEKFIQELRGMWAFCIYDGLRHQLVLSRDQFGIKPLFYSHVGGELYFSSELSSFRKWNINLTPDNEAYNIFFNLGYFASPDTCYREVKSVSPGEFIKFDYQDDVINSTLNTYQSPEFEINSDKDLISNFHDVLMNSVNAHFISDVPVGLLFSGGNDSSLLAALAVESGYKPRAFHLSVDGGGDTEYAVKIAKHLGLKMENIHMNVQELVQQYDRIWESQTLPFADTSVIPTSLIFEKVKGESKVVLSGEGGDDYFGGYPRHRRLIKKRILSSPSVVTDMIDSFYGSSRLRLELFNPALSRLKRKYIDLLTKDVIATYLSETKLVDYPINRKAIWARLHDSISGNSDVPASLHFDRHLYLPNNLLFKADFSSMLSSIEARVPLVDVEVDYFIKSQIPPKMQLSDRFTNKYLLKKVLERYLPGDLVYRTKKGFSFSFQRYKVPSFQNDVEKSLEFHAREADAFGLVDQSGLLNKSNASILIKKYPRFAFALVSNWKFMTRR